MAGVRRDIVLIELFLSHYKDAAGNNYRIAERPEETERVNPAIEAIAVDEQGDRLAIEHTLIEPFAGQKADDRRFLAVFGGLDRAVELRVPDTLIEVTVPVGAIPNGVDWEEVGRKVYDWFAAARWELPEGASDHDVPDLSFPLRVHVETVDIPHTPGVVVVSRFLPRDRPFEDILRRALGSKLPKLIGTPARTHILLLEDASIALGSAQVALGLRGLRPEFPQLVNVDAIWVAKTPAWEAERIVWFFHVWPNGVGERFSAPV
jgi:hypothetical protein